MFNLVYGVIQRVMRVYSNYNIIVKIQVLFCRQT